MKAILISIKPQYCELISTGKKTIEVRKSKPKLEIPFKCYIYCTNDRSDILWVLKENLRKICDGKTTAFFRAKEGGGVTKANGKVIGEFICNDIFNLVEDENAIIALANVDLSKCCLTYDDIHKYANGKKIYGWNISNLIIYDEPKEISEFKKPLSVMEKIIDDDGYWLCDACPDAKWEGAHLIKCSNSYCSHRTINRPPQSWCYVEKLNSEEFFVVKIEDDRKSLNDILNSDAYERSTRFVVNLGDPLNREMAESLAEHSKNQKEIDNMGVALGYCIV